MDNKEFSKIILKCYGHKKKKGDWYGICLDLNLATEANTFNELVDKLNNKIESYLEVVIDTNDKDSIPKLLCRPAPIQDWLMYYFISFILILHKLKNNISYKKTIHFYIS